MSLARYKFGGGAYNELGHLLQRCLKDCQLIEMAKYDVTLQLADQRCSAHAILAAVRRELRIIDCPEEDIRRFTEEATRKDYRHLLQTCRQWIVVHDE